MKTGKNSSKQTMKADGVTQGALVQVGKWMRLEIGGGLKFAVQLGDSRFGILHVDEPCCLKDGRRRSLVLTVVDPGNGDGTTRYDDQEIGMPAALAREIVACRISALAQSVQSSVWEQYDASDNPELAICAECDVLIRTPTEEELGFLIDDLSEHGVDLGFVEDEDIQDLMALQQDLRRLPREDGAVND